MDILKYVSHSMNLWILLSHFETHVKCLLYWPDLSIVPVFSTFNFFFFLLQQILDEDDEKLQKLKNDWGEEVYKAVETALLEMNEYNAIARYVVPELWNNKEGRRASLKELVQYLLKQIKSLKYAKRRKLRYDDG